MNQILVLSLLFLNLSLTHYLKLYIPVTTADKKHNHSSNNEYVCLSNVHKNRCAPGIFHGVGADPEAIY